MSEPAEDIMRATFCALSTQGYADLTMQDIADEADRSKASLHYHYDSKQALLAAFLEHMHEQYVEHVPATAVPEGERADERLRDFLDAAFHPPGDGPFQEFRTALLEIKAQAPYDETYRERLAAFDDHVYDAVHDLVAKGVERGEYRADTDPDAVARFVRTVLDGALTRHATAGESVDAAQAQLEAYLDAHLAEPEGPS